MIKKYAFLNWNNTKTGDFHILTQRCFNVASVLQAILRLLNNVELMFYLCWA